VAVAQSGAAAVPATPAPPPTRYASEHMKIFALSDGKLEVFGFAPKSSVGILGGRFYPITSLLGSDPGLVRRFDGDDGWHIEVYFIDTNILGQSIYQVNLYDPAGVLQDDGYHFVGG